MFSILNVSSAVNTPDKTQSVSPPKTHTHTHTSSTGIYFHFRIDAKFGRYSEKYMYDVGVSTVRRVVSPVNDAILVFTTAKHSKHQQ